MDPRDLLLGSARDDARTLLAAAEVDWTRAVPSCPDWDVADLTRHLGTVFLWIGANVSTGERAHRDQLGPVPEDPAALPAWFGASLDRVLGVLGQADPDAETWTFAGSGDRRVAWWWRRVAVETALHRWDVQHAAAATGEAPPAPLGGEVAAGGIEELVVDFLPGLLRQEGLRGLRGTLHLHATDGQSEWWVDLGAGGASRADHAKADTAIRATRSDLLLFLWNRQPEQLEVFGDRTVLEDWKQLKR